jgi:hypothetical protein
LYAAKLGTITNGHRPYGLHDGAPTVTFNRASKISLFRHAAVMADNCGGDRHVPRLFGFGRASLLVIRFRFLDLKTTDHHLKLRPILAKVVEHSRSMGAFGQRRASGQCGARVCTPATPLASSGLARAAIGVREVPDTNERSNQAWGLTIPATAIVSRG